MNYEGNIIRPPSEAHSIILQITVGCSHNKCTFCGAYKGVRFYIKDAASINDDIAFAARYCQNQKRVFLADGDALIIPTARLEEIFSSIRQNLPWVNRINLYGNTKSILRKTVGELKRLKELGLDRVYMGLESGHEPTLTNIKKGVNTEQMITGSGNDSCSRPFSLCHCPARYCRSSSIHPPCQRNRPGSDKNEAKSDSGPDLDGAEKHTIVQ